MAYFSRNYSQHEELLENNVQARRVRDKPTGKTLIIFPIICVFEIFFVYLQLQKEPT